MIQEHQSGHTQEVVQSEKAGTEEPEDSWEVTAWVSNNEQ